MPQRKKYKDRASKQKAYRERKNAREVKRELRVIRKSGLIDIFSLLKMEWIEEKDKTDACTMAEYEEVRKSSFTREEGIFRLLDNTFRGEVRFPGVSKVESEQKPKVVPQRTRKDKEGEYGFGKRTSMWRGY
jgi:hypothetical protein